MNRLNVLFHGIREHDPISMGTLVWHDDRAWFEFSSDFLDLGINPSPLLLEKTTKPQPAPLSPFGGLHAVFHNSLPDGWGMFVLSRYIQQCGIPANSITPLTQLAFIGDRCMGALSYVPSHSKSPTVNTQIELDLEHVGIDISNLYGGSASNISQCLAANATPIAGGQPKLLVGYDGNQVIEGAGNLPRGFSHWLVKLSSDENPGARWDGTMEYLYALMAKTAGIHMTGVRLIPGEHGYCQYLTRRFDRTSSGRRVFVQSAACLLNEDCRSTTLEYLDLFKLSDFLTHNYANKLFLYRQMVFNIMSGNRDDHLGNFGFMLSNSGEWSCTPGYDISWNTGMGGKHSMGINGRRLDVPRSDALDVARQASISRRDALAAIDQVRDALGSFDSLLQEHEVPIEAMGETADHFKRQVAVFSMNS